MKSVLLRSLRRSRWAHEQVLPLRIHSIDLHLIVNFANHGGRDVGAAADSLEHSCTPLLLASLLPANRPRECPSLSPAKLGLCPTFPLGISLLA